MPRGSCVGSAERHAATTRAGVAVHIPPRSSGCPGRNYCRCVPAARSARSCTADSSSGLPSCERAREPLDNAAQCWHKGRAKRALPREHAEGPGFCHELARAFVYSASTPRIAQCVLASFPGHSHRSHRERRLDLQRRLIQSDDPARHHRIEIEIPCQCKTRSKRFRKHASNLKITRICNPDYTYHHPAAHPVVTPRCDCAAVSRRRSSPTPTVMGGTW